MIYKLISVMLPQPGNQSRKKREAVVKGKAKDRIR